MLKNIKAIIIDVDDCMYPKSLGIGKQFVERVEQYAKNLLKYDDKQTVELLSIWTKDDEKGLAFLHERGVNRENAMDYICALDVSKIEYDDKLRKQLEEFPIRKIVYTNSTHSHIDDVLNGQLKIKDLFEDFYTTKESGYVFKHNALAFEKILKYYDLEAGTTAMLEDNPKYLAAAKQNGITTIWVRENMDSAAYPYKDKDYPYVDYIVKDINQALGLFKTGNMVRDRALAEAMSR
ncbi:MAG: HAD hydrolase-like protein [Lactobacillaceae bacterium]|jgi:putative hydrolase of the HAD superfamily|nr:HAD hydrolase-like protein [Lactobacillaceae bacterium]